VILKNLLFRAN